MIRKAILFLVIFFISGISLVYALDWKALHEKADSINLSIALADAKAKPNSIDDLYVLSLVYLNLHKNKEALEVYNKILILDPRIIEARWGMAEVFFRQHNAKKSGELLYEVLKENSDFSPASMTLAYIKYSQLDFNESARLASKVLRQGEKKVDLSNHVRAHLLYGGSKGMIAHNGGALSKVINGTAVFSSLRAAEKLQPNSAGVKFGLGSFYMLAPSFVGGDLKKAQEYLEKAIEIDPFFADVYVRLAQLYKIKGDNARYDEYLNKALKIDSQSELALDIKSGRCNFICFNKGKK